MDDGGTGYSSPLPVKQASAEPEPMELLEPFLSPPLPLPSLLLLLLSLLCVDPDFEILIDFK